MKFSYANVDRLEEADAVFIGVPDESGSYSHSKGSSLAPDRIRKISNEMSVFKRQGKKYLAQPLILLNKKIMDYGNVKKIDISELIKNISQINKIPVVLGGDHSITAEVLKGFDKKISLIYFDAHPDFVCSTTGDYGSVVSDILKYKNVDVSSSIFVGIREPELEELENIMKNKLNIITSDDLVDMGIKNATDKILNSVGDNIYVSIDMDAVDPAFAPGVTVPVPGGLTSTDLLYMLRRIAKTDVVGFDIMEICPKYDVQDMTSNLAIKIIIEMLANCKNS